MAINPTVARTADGGWHFTWPVGVGPYPIWNNGVLLDTVTDESFLFNQPGYEQVPPELEILNAADVSEQEAYPCFALLQWRGLQTAAFYLVEQLVGATWITRANLQEVGAGYYTWRSRALTDADVVQFRVTALDIQGNAGTAISFSFEVCRNPLAPRISVGFSTAGDLVVSEV